MKRNDEMRIFLARYIFLVFYISIEYTKWGMSHPSSCRVLPLIFVTRYSFEYIMQVNVNLKTAIYKKTFFCAKAFTFSFKNEFLLYSLVVIPFEILSICTCRAFLTSNPLKEYGSKDTSYNTYNNRRIL